MPVTVTVAQLKTIAGPGHGAPLAAKLVGPINRYAAANDIDTPLLMAHFLCHMVPETGGFSNMSESLNYSVSGLKKTFSRARISAKDCDRLGRPENVRTPLSQERQRQIANIVYGGEWGKKNLGNVEPDDGWRYRGGGPYQLTGRANYRKFGKAAGVDLEGNPELARDPDTGIEVAAKYFRARMLKAAANDDIRAATVALNGGTTALAERTAALGRAKSVLRASPPAAAPSKPVNRVISNIPDDPNPVADPDKSDPSGLAQGSPPIMLPSGKFDPEPANPEVKAVDLLTPLTDEHRVRLTQTYLRNLNYMPIGDIDGKLGTFTTDAIIAYRTAKGLPISKDVDFLLMGTLASDNEPRQFADKRANATPAEVREKVPEAAANWKTKIVGFVLGIPAAVGAAIQGVFGQFDAAKGWIDPIKDYLSDVPSWAWLVGVAGIAYFLYRTGTAGEKASVEAVQTGARR